LYSAFVSSEPFLDGPGNVNVYFIIIEFLEGGLIDEERWKGFDNWSRETIFSRLSEQFQLLRAVPQGPGPQPYYGRVNNQSFQWEEPLLMVRCTDMYGPYNTYEDLDSAMYCALEARTADSISGPEFHPVHAEMLLEFKPAVRRSTHQRPVLTHRDFCLQNTIARPVRDKANRIIDWEIAIIDWATLAWLPAFIEPAGAEWYLPGKEDEDWERLMCTIFPDWNSYKEEREFWCRYDDEVSYTFE
jgi:hypothetical protein